MVEHNPSDHASGTSGLPVREEPHGLRIAIFWVMFALLLLYAAALTCTLFVVFISSRSTHAMLTTLVVNHFPAIVGAPLISVLAFIVVWAFRATEGQIEIDLWGLKLKGASGPILLWTVAMLTLSLAVRMLW